MSNSGIESRLDRLLEKVAGGAHVSPQHMEGREVARVVKRTEVASVAHKRNLVKYIVIGVAIILLLVGIIYFVAKTKYGQNIKVKLMSMLPGKKKRSLTDMKKTGASGPLGPHLVAQDVDFRTKRAHIGGPNGGPQGPNGGPNGGPPHPPPRPSVTVTVPRIPKPNVPEGDEDEELDPGAVRFRRRKGRPGQAVRPAQVGPPPPIDDAAPGQGPPNGPPNGRPQRGNRGGRGGRQPKRGPSPPIDDSGPPPPKELTDASSYEND
jgi:hypothetical protein